MINFSDLIKSKRESLNIKLIELQEKTNITASYIARVEKKQIKSVSAEYAFKLAEALDIPMDELAKVFNVKLSDTTEEATINSLKNKTDYILIKQAIECLLDISNDTNDYYESTNTLRKICDELRKSKVSVIGSTDDGNADYCIEVKNDKYIIEFVSTTLRRKLGAKVRVLEGRYINSDNDINYYELDDFIQDFLDDDDLEKDEISEYILQNNY